MSLPDDNSSAARLRSYIERIERLLEEIKGIQADVKQIKAEAKGQGFCVKTMVKMIKLRAMEENDRAEQEALEDIYKAALGLLNDTPLGQAALDRLTRKPKPATPVTPQAPAGGDGDDVEAQPTPSIPHPSNSTSKEAAAVEPAPPKTTIADALEMGRQAALDGLPVTDNPFPARDPNRAAWDEAWCQTSGSDGMDLPEAWRRSRPVRKDQDASRKGGE